MVQVLYRGLQPECLARKRLYSDAKTVMPWWCAASDPGDPIIRLLMPASDTPSARSIPNPIQHTGGRP